jgi:hypothetical protein
MRACQGKLGIHIHKLRTRIAILRAPVAMRVHVHAALHVNAAPVAAHASRRRVPVRAAPCRPLRAQRDGSGDSGNAPEEEPDLVSRFVAAIFGKKVLEDPKPSGLQRMTKADWPDQWPAVVDEFAEPVEGDAGEVALLRPLLRQTQARLALDALCARHAADARLLQLERQPLALAYDASVHGWSSSAFHTQMDGLGAAVLVLETEGGALCGGCVVRCALRAASSCETRYLASQPLTCLLCARSYNPKGYLGYGDWRDAISAFLFTWPDGDTSKRAMKLPKTVRAALAARAHAARALAARAHTARACLQRSARAQIVCARSATRAGRQRHGHHRRARRGASIRA